MLTSTLTAAFALLLIASVCDFRSREIPDWISIAIAVVAIVASLAGWLGIGLMWAVAGGIVGLLLGYGLFQFAQLGGGDAKLIASLGMLLGPAGILILCFGMAIAGGVLSLIAMLRGQRDYAYVPAITAGFVWYVKIVSLL
ncbi:A24 family peptidase [Novipirellula caenicola]|uniref:Prepilin type IV endopeptidase peptidase domain-containing protein n=1 Tax=Novipirellula caenicola TaxID=1536901 RepID=A0ABP9VLE3_9BACT